MAYSPVGRGTHRGERRHTLGSSQTAIAEYIGGWHYDSSRIESDDTTPVLGRDESEHLWARV